jgi:hypothetical protein
MRKPSPKGIKIKKKQNIFSSGNFNRLLSIASGDNKHIEKIEEVKAIDEKPTDGEMNCMNTEGNEMDKFFESTESF